MLVSLSGRERTRAEFEALLDPAGLDIERSVDLGGEFQALVCRARRPRSGA